MSTIENLKKDYELSLQNVLTEYNSGSINFATYSSQKNELDKILREDVTNTNENKKESKVLGCGKDKLVSLFEKYRLKQGSPQVRSIPKTSIIKKNLPNNPYTSSITGRYAFDLSKVKNFSVYFWKSTDDPNQNLAIADILFEYDTTAVNWSNLYQTQTLKALGQFTSFTNTTYTVSTSYKTCDIVCVLGKNFDFLGACYAPSDLYDYPLYVDNKMCIFLNDAFTNVNNIKDGGSSYFVLIHEFGHGFGLSHPQDTGSGSRIIPGINPNSIRGYEAMSAYGENTQTMTVMSYFVEQFFFPADFDYTTSTIGYAQTLMPLDVLGLRWLYNISGTSANYITKYGVSNINPAANENKTQMIVGQNQKISFGSNCKNISFYFSNQHITANNILPIVYEYNRILEKEWGYYPKDVASTVSELNFNNTVISNVFIENNGMKVNLTLNLIKNKVFNMYIQDLKSSYTIVNNLYTNTKTKLTIKINNTAKAVVNVFFNI
jgi:hypothetical protein